MIELSAAARNLNWLVQSFAERVPGVSEAVVVSSDGLPIAASSGLDREAADRVPVASDHCTTATGAICMLVFGIENVARIYIPQAGAAGHVQHLRRPVDAPELGTLARLDAFLLEESAPRPIGHQNSP